MLVTDLLKSMNFTTFAALVIKQSMPIIGKTQIKFEGKDLVAFFKRQAKEFELQEEEENLTKTQIAEKRKAEREKLGIVKQEKKKEVQEQPKVEIEKSVAQDKKKEKLAKKIEEIKKAERPYAFSSGIDLLQKLYRYLNGLKRNPDCKESQ